MQKDNDDHRVAAVTSVDFVYSSAQLPCACLFPKIILSFGDRML